MNMNTQPDSGSVIAGFIFIGLLVALYFLPTIIGRKKANRTAIFWLNFLLGWSFVGWVVALIWALTVDKKNA